VSEILNRKRASSLHIVKRLHDGLRIPCESLLAGVRQDASAVMTPPVFRHYRGMHHARAETPGSGLRSLRDSSATPQTLPQEVLPPPGPRKYWCRRELAHWLAGELAGDTPTIVGIDHALSFPLRYFEVHQLAPEGRETARSGRQ
jgi:hypothetical protein